MNDQDVAITELSRQKTYASLAKCYRLPGPGLRELLEALENQLQALESKALPHARLLLESFIANNDIRSLHVDYAKLFVGPYTLLAPPYGSVYMESERRIMGDSTMEVIKYYHEAGLDVAWDYKDAPDHIATELEFMYYLINEEIGALAKGDDQTFVDILRIQKAFMNNHLNKWVRPFAQSVKSGTGSDYYVNLADVTHIFVAEDAEYLLNLEIHQDV